MSYTKSEELTLTNASPVTYEKAVALSATMGKPLKSIISKLQFLGLEYIKKETPAPKPPQATKAELVAKIEKALGYPTLTGLGGATRDSLVDLLALVTG